MLCVLIILATLCLTNRLAFRDTTVVTDMGGAFFYEERFNPAVVASGFDMVFVHCESAVGEMRMYTLLWLLVPCIKRHAHVLLAMCLHCVLQCMHGRVHGQRLHVYHATYCPALRMDNA